MIFWFTPSCTITAVLIYEIHAFYYFNLKTYVLCVQITHSRELCLIYAYHLKFQMNNRTGRTAWPPPSPHQIHEIKLKLTVNARADDTPAIKLD